MAILLLNVRKGQLKSFSFVRPTYKNYNSAPCEHAGNHRSTKFPKVVFDLSEQRGLYPNPLGYDSTLEGVERLALFLCFPLSLLLSCANSIL